MLFGEIHLYQSLQCLIRRNRPNNARGEGVGFSTCSVCRFSQHGFTGLKVSIKGTMRQSRFFHDVGHARSVIATAANGFGGSIHYALVGGFLGSCSQINGRFSHDVHHTECADNPQNC